MLTGITLAASLYWLRPVMIPLVLAIFFSLGLSMISDSLVTKWKVPRFVAMGITLFVAILLFFLLVTLVSSSVRQLAQQAGAYEESINKMAQDLINKLPLERLGIESTRDINQIMTVSSERIGNMLLTTTNTILDLVKQSVLVLIFTFFLLIGKGWRPPGERSSMVEEIEKRVKGYLLTKTAVSAATGTFVGFFLYLLNVDLAMVFGLAAFLLNFIPSVGSIMATLLPLPVVLISPEAGPGTFFWALFLPGGTQVVIGNLIEPKIMGDNLELHPVVILSALIFWGMLWGVVGMFLAVPMTAILSILLARWEYTKPLADLLAGKLPNLGP